MTRFVTTLFIVGLLAACGDRTELFSIPPDVVDADAAVDSSPRGRPETKPICELSALEQPLPVDCAVAGVQKGAPWPVAWGRCPSRTAQSGVVGPQSPHIRWIFPARGLVVLAPAVAADGTLYVASDGVTSYAGFGPSLQALRPDGTLKWTFTLDYGALGPPVIGEDGTVYIGLASERTSVQGYAINPDGTVKWALGPNAVNVPNPVIGTDQTVYFASETVQAVRPNGTNAWSFKPTNGQPFSGAPAVGPDGTLYAAGSDSQAALYALKPGGTAKWALQADLVSFPNLGADGTIYVGAYGSTEGILALSPEGTKKWAFTSTGPLTVGAIAASGMLYVGAPVIELSQLFAICPDGTEKWSLPYGIGINACAVAADGTIYAVDSTALHAISPDGREVWSYPKTMGFDACSMAADGTLYAVGGLDGMLYAFGT